MKRIGIMGGTFNPIHYGHLISAESVKQSMNLDNILFIPTGNPPHKLNNELIDKTHRFNMVTCAIEDNNGFIVSNIEIDRTGVTYTIDTLRELHEIYHDDVFYFIIGFDTLKEIGSWKNIDEICTLCSFIVVNRNSSIEELNLELQLKREQFKVSIEVVNMPNIDISSTYIRNSLEENKSIRYLTPDAVINYIAEKTYTNDEISEIHLSCITLTKIL